MARRRRNDKPIELFPFLAILACVIGVLTLLIAGLSMGALDIDTSGTEFALLKSATAADEEEIERLEKSARGGRIRNARVRHARAELARREAASAGMDKLEAERDGLLAEHMRASKERDELQEEVRLLQDQVSKLQTEIASLGGARGSARPVKLIGPKARRGQRKLAPRFVECRKDTIVLDADLKGAGRKVLAMSRIASGETLIRFLLEVNRSANGIVILLVREGGVDAHDLMAAICKRLQVRCGKLPIPGAGNIDFSPLRKRR